MTEKVAFIVVPCYNEANRFPELLFRTFLASPASKGIFFRFVDDGSTDTTVSLLKALANDYPEQCSVMVLAQNKGKAEAIRCGMMSLDKSVQYAGYWDADLATPLTEIAHLYSEAENYDHPDMVVGSRIKLLGTTRIERYWFRHYFGRLFATLVSTMLGIAIYDTQCGAKLIKENRIKALFGTPFISKWLFDVELIFRLMREVPNRFSIIEVPLKEWIEKGESKVQFFYLFKVPLELALIFIKNRKYRYRKA
jgi:glycosyltransferase involved in cell wall biosynthesis